MNEYIIECEYDSDEGWIPGEHREGIVRCRDCKFGEQQIVRFSPDPIFVCLADWCKGSEGDNPLVDIDGFCAWGERKVVGE